MTPEEMNELVGSMSDAEKNALLDIRDPHRPFCVDSEEIKQDLLAKSIVRELEESEPTGNLKTINPRGKIVQLSVVGLQVFLRLWSDYVEQHDVANYHKIPDLLDESLSEKLGPKIRRECKHSHFNAAVWIEPEQETGQLFAELRMRCADCECPMLFDGESAKAVKSDVTGDVSILRVAINPKPAPPEGPAEEKITDG